MNSVFGHKFSKGGSEKQSDRFFRIKVDLLCKKSMLLVQSIVFHLYFGQN